MKYILVAILTMSFTMSLMNAAHAGDGEVHFDGSIISDACVVDTAGEGISVNMGDVSTNALHIAGMHASPTKFTINLTGCPTSIKQVAVTFDGVHDKVNSHMLRLDEGQTAQGVAIQISDKYNKTIPIGEESIAYSVDDNGSASLDFIACYIKTDGTDVSLTAGTANATSQFTINYQ